MRRILDSIMLVDDDSITNYLNELLIKGMGITQELVIASDGQEALDIISTRCAVEGKYPNLILLDVNMPVINGFGFLKKINEMELENKQEIVIVMLSTSLNPRDKERALTLNVKDYICKPLTKEGLEKILHKHFDFE